MIGILHLAKSVMFLVHFLTGFLNAHAEYMHRSSKANGGCIKPMFSFYLKRVAH